MPQPRGPLRTPEQTNAPETPPHRLRVVAAPGILRSTTAPRSHGRMLMTICSDRQKRNGFEMSCNSSACHVPRSGEFSGAGRNRSERV